MKARSSLIIAAFLVFLVPAARAQDPGLEGRVSVAVQGGLVTEVSGNVLVHTEGMLFAQPATLYSNSFRKVYETGFSFFYAAGTIGYGVTPGGEIFARGTYLDKDPINFLAGTVTYQDEAGVATDSNLAAVLEPYREWGVEAGYRFYLAWRTGLKSYVAPVGGIRFTDRILIVSMSASDRGSYIQNVPLYKASTVPVFGADIGFTFDLGTHLYLGLEAEIRYQTKLDPADQSFPGLAGINSAGDRWSAPVFLTFGGRF